MFISLRRPEDAEELDRLIRTTSDAKQRDRLRSIRLAIDGEQTAAIQRALGRSRGFVQRWCYAYRDHGLDAIGATPQSGRPTTLPHDRHETFRRRVLDGPTEADGVCTLRGRDLLGILESEFGVSYTLNGLYGLLARLDLVVLAPRPKHRKSDPEAMRRWVERAPPLSIESEENARTKASRCGSRTKHASASRAR